MFVSVLNQQLDFQRKNSFVLSFKTFSADINVTWRSIISVAYMWRKIVLAIKFWFKDDYCLRIVVSNTYWIVFLFCCSSSSTPCRQFLWIIQFWLPLRYSLTFISLGQRLSFLFNRTNILYIWQLSRLFI